ncbi:hypothetical protein KHA80_22240 [Anaerobacillus sp. HL2]|nr:hypothetical protein KHA80_22240 [Anaerobacillus sp. HL2]
MIFTIYLYGNQPNITLPIELRSIEVGEEKIDDDGYGTLRLKVKLMI